MKGQMLSSIMNKSGTMREPVVAQKLVQDRGIAVLEIDVVVGDFADEGARRLGLVAEVAVHHGL